MATLRTGGFFVSGGTMPLDSASYVERQSDKVLLQSLLEGRYCYVLNSRQMGKSSLSVRVMSRLAEAEVGTVLIDLTRIGGRNVTAVQWYAGLCDEVGGAFGLRTEMMGYFRQNSSLSPMRRFFGAIDEVLLEMREGRFAIFIDEIDATRNLNFDADEFFAGIRECFNRRVRDGRFARLTFCLIGVAVPSDLIRNPATTPFNVGERIQLNDFSREEMAHLAAPLGPTGRQLIERVHYWTGGQPFLTQTLCEAISRDDGVRSPADVDALVQTQLFDPKARTTNINLADVGNRALHAGAAEPDPSKFQADLLTAYERIWKGGSLPDDESNRIAVMLKLSGLTRSDGRSLSVRNRIYHHVFDRVWVRENMPNRELVRERQAFRRGIARAATASTLVIGIVSVLGALAWSSRQSEAEARSQLDYELYVADMNNMRMLEETGDVARMKDLLVRTEGSRWRGFEWSFWQRRIHDSDEEYTLDYSAPGKREQGTLSRDGLQICIYDSLAGVACVVDRKTKKTIAQRVIGPRCTILTRPLGFAYGDDVGLNQRAEIRDLTTGQVIFHLQPPGHQWGSVVVRPDSDLILAMAPPEPSMEHRELVLYNIETGKPAFKCEVDRSFANWPMSFSADGRRVVYSVVGGKVPDSRLRMVTVDTTTGRSRTFELPTGPNARDFIALSGSGRFLVYQDENLGTTCFDIDAGRPASNVKGKADDVPMTGIALAGNQVYGGLFSSGHADFFRVSDASPIASIRQVWDMKPGKSGDQVVASSTSVRIVSLEAAGDGSIVGAGVRVVRTGTGQLTSWIGNRQGIDLYEDPDLKPLAHFDPPRDQRSGYTYNGKWCVAVNSAGEFCIVDPTGKTPPFRLASNPINFSCGITLKLVATLERGSRQVAAFSGGTGERLWTYDVPGGGVTSLWVTPDSKNVLIGMGDTDLLVLDGETGRFRTRFQGHNVKLSNLAFAKGGKLVFSCGADGRAIMWDLVSAREVREFRGNVAQRISSADMSPDGSRVATCNLAGAWQLWDTQTGVQLMEVQASSLPLRSILFTSDGRSIVTAGDDTHVRRWGILDRDPTVRISVPPDLLKDIRR